MGRKYRLIERLSSSTVFPQDALPGVPVVEIAGKCRVLIEYHHGVTEYESQRIRVKMDYGSLIILGDRLTLAHMSKERLVVSGIIHQLCIC